MEVVDSEYASYRDVVSRLIKTPDQFPQLPSITQDIRQALVRTDISMAEAARLLSCDSVLSNILLRYASSVMMSHHMPPQNMFDVVRVLGMRQVERITLVHAIKSLFSGNTQAYTRIFAVAWDRLVQKAAASAFIAKKVGRVAPDYALLGSLLSEVGTLAVLAAFKSGQLAVPSADIYVSLCREFAKDYGALLLENWGVEAEYIQLIRRVGNWYMGENEPFGLVDVVNLGLYHALKARMTPQRLPPITNLAAYQKLSDKHNAITDTNELELVVVSRDDIRLIADSLY